MTSFHMRTRWGGGEADIGPRSTWTRSSLYCYVLTSDNYHYLLGFRGEGWQVDIVARCDPTHCSAYFGLLTTINTQCRACPFLQAALCRSETIARFHSHSFLTLKVTHLPRHIYLRITVVHVKLQSKSSAQAMKKSSGEARKNPVHKRVLAPLQPR